MNLFFPIRWKLTFWYSGIVLISLLLFALISYIWFSRDLYDNLDDSLIKISKTLTHIIIESTENDSHQYDIIKQLGRHQSRFKLFAQEEQLRFVGPLRPGYEQKIAGKSDIVWSAIFKHLLLNPDNYYIQLSDTTERIVWRSRNLEFYKLPISLSREEVDRQFKIATHNFYFDNVIISGKKLRLLIDRNPVAIITIAYTVDEVQKTLRDLFSFFMFSIPLILLFSLGGGIFLTKITLSPIDKITKTANEITAKNLKMRLSLPPTNDEFSRLIETLNRMISRLEKSFNQIKQFTSDASHELRTPLTILRGELELALNSDRTVEEYQEVIASALDEVLRMSKIIDSLLELTRADTGQTKMQLKNGNFSNLLNDLIEETEILAMEKNIEIISNVAENVVFYYDEIRMTQAIFNILDNAIKYNKLNGKIYIELYDRGTYIELSVKDTGYGIDGMELGNIFNRFYRIDKSRGGQIKGTGLGLSIVKWIVESHNGKIYVESEVNKGTNFIIMLPKDGKKFELNIIKS